MYYSKPIYDVYGRYYVICDYGLAHKASSFMLVEYPTIQFLSKLKVSNTFWRDVLTKYGFGSRLFFMNENEVIQNIYYLLEHRRLRIYVLPPMLMEYKNSTQLTFRHNQNHQTYQFSYIPLSYKGSFHQHEKFENNEEARAFIQTLEISSPQFLALNKLFTPTQVGVELLAEDEILKALSEALVDGNVLVTPQTFVGPPLIDSSKTEGETSFGGRRKRSETVTVRTANGDESESKEKVEKPLCQRNSITVSCSHGRSVTLDANVSHMPTLDVVATSVSGKKPEKMTIISDITDICDDHKHGHISVSRDDLNVKLVDSGKKSEFEFYGENLNIRNNPVKYAWLPNIKPQSCEIYPGKSCDDSKRNKMGRGIVVNVYPNVAWDWGVTFGYGTDEHTLTENDNRKGSYKKALSNKRFSLTGAVKLTQDNETFELNSEFKEAVESTVKQIDAITNLVDGVIGHFDEGRKPKVTITWPNISLNLKTEITEGKDNYRTVGFDFGISSPTFLGLAVEVDILPVIAKPLDGGVISKWLIEEAQASLKKGVGNKDGLAYLEGDVSVIMKGEGSLGFEVHFQGDFSNNTNRIEKVSGKPVTGKIEFSAEGKVELKGHLLKVKVELVAGVGIKSGITLGMEIDSDEKGYYWKPEAIFNGVRVYITKYVKTKSDTGSTSKPSKLKKRRTTPNLKENKTKEYVWISEEKLETAKRYFIEY